MFDNNEVYNHLFKV